jgi:hypothetical protein
MVAFTPAAPWSIVFIVASFTTIFAMASLAASAATALSVATFAVMASSAAFTAAVSSAVLISATFSTATTAAETSHAIKVDPLQLDLPSGVDVTTLEPGYGAVAALGVCCPDSEGSLTVDPPLWNCLILLCRVTSTSDDSSASLSTI